MKTRRAERRRFSLKARRREWWIALIGLSTCFFQLLRAEISPALAEATKPLREGVPEVAVVRLRTLLDNSLADETWRAVAEKLAEAQVTAKQPEDALVLLADSRLHEVPSAKFWRAQALASLHRWAEALPLYEELAVATNPLFRGLATFGAAEMLRALGRQDEALAKMLVLLRDKEWSIPAGLRSAELYINKADAGNARPILDEMQPKLVAERKERRLLRGRLELVLQRPERAIAVFQALLKRPEGAAHDTLIAALFGIADAHLQLKTAEAGDDAIERFIDHHPEIGRAHV